MIRHHCIAELHDDEDELTLWFKLADGRVIALTYSKNGDPPHVSFSRGCGSVRRFRLLFSNAGRVRGLGQDRTQRHESGPRTAMALSNLQRAARSWTDVARRHLGRHKGCSRSRL
jgi:hypothetical protein